MSPSPQRPRFTLNREAVLLAIIVVMVVAVGARAPVFLTARNALDIGNDSATLAILVMGQMMVLLTRGVDLSVASNLALTGMLCALAGSYLVLAQNASFVPHMTAGRGFMALAAMIFGKWHPVGAFWACLLFGFLDAVAIRLQGVHLPGLGEVPVPAIQALPYVLTVVLLAGFIGRSMAPAELGKPYVKER
jgi:ABC-type uncharacterized transport system permease subunit